MQPEIAVIVSTYQRPSHLKRCLLSLCLQRDVAGRMEVVVADDGSQDETAAVVNCFARRASFRLAFTTHPHDGFRLAQSRNEGVRASTASYLLFVDGDCVLPSDHVRQHLDFRRTGSAAAGDCARLDQTASAGVNDGAVLSQRIHQLVTKREQKRVRTKALKGRVYNRLGLANRPRLTGNNIGVARTDFERINGFDEMFVGWGLEDRDLQRRLAMIGVRFRSILHRTTTYHLWHPSDPTFVRNNEDTWNLQYFRATCVSAFCQHGLQQTKDREVDVQWCAA
jgi:glycosyltransferase involved in cell wall biosynthesis